MRQLLSGNEAVARGAWEAGCSFASSYPGTPATEILENLSKYDEVYAEWAPNEKVALESAIGASYAGVRALASMKHVGLNVAADPFMTLSYTGVNAGMVIAVADDPGLYSSQNEQDTRHYVRAARIVAFEPSDSQEAFDFTKYAFEVSERFDTPVLIRLTTRISHTKTVVERLSDRSLFKKDVKFDVEKWVMLPAYARKRHPLVIERYNKLKKFAAEFDGNRIEIRDKRLGFITSGVVYNYVKEAFPDASVLKLSVVYPLSPDLIGKFISSIDGEVYVVEELDPFLETEIRAMGFSVRGKDVFPEIGEFNPDIVKSCIDKNYKPKVFSVPDIPDRPPTLCPGCPHRGVFVALRKAAMRSFGDIGCYTLGAIEPLKSIHSCVCMGAGVSMEHGASVSGLKGTVAIIGDSTFFHSGVTSLMNISYNNSPSIVIILDNRTTAMTGKQPHPGVGVTAKGKKTRSLTPEDFARFLGIEKVFVIDPYNVLELVEVLKKYRNTEEPVVIVTKRACTLISSKPNVVYKILDEKCDGCKRCLSVGCIALGYENNKAFIDPILCWGCGVCAVECPKEAIVKV